MIWDLFRWCYHNRRRIAIPRFRDYMYMRLLKSGCARWSVTHALIPRAHTYRMRIDKEKIQEKSARRHEQNRLPSRIWMLFCVLLVSMSPNSCSGACVMHALNLAPNQKLVACTIKLNHNTGTHIIICCTFFHSNSYPILNSAPLLRLPPTPHI